MGFAIAREIDGAIAPVNKKRPQNFRPLAAIHAADFSGR
jgi:hypothetical protein